MKKYNFVSIMLVLCLLISSMGTFPVFASETEPKLLFELDMSEFNKETEDTWGLKNGVAGGDEVTITARDGYNDEDQSYKMITGVSTKESFKTSQDAEPVDYILQVPTNNTDASRHQETENTRIIIENKDWATKATTTEIWAYKERKTRASWLSFFRDTGDRTAFDKVLSLGEDSSARNTLSLTGETIAAFDVGGNGEYRWYLFTLIATPVDSNEDNIFDQMKYQLQVNDKTNDTLVQIADISADEYYGIMIGNPSDTNIYVQKQLGVASVKVYEGALSTEAVTAHYEAEKATYGITSSQPTGLSMKYPAVSSVSPDGGANIDCRGDKFTVKFSLPVDNATVDEGVVLKDPSGNAVPYEKTLSSDGKTLTMTTGTIRAGEYKLKVTSALKGLNGKSVADNTYTYTATPLDIKLDFSDTSVWTTGTYNKDTIANQGTGNIKYTSDFSTTSGQSYIVDTTAGTMTLNSASQAYMKIDLGGAVSEGTLVADFWFKHIDKSTNATKTFKNLRDFCIIQTADTKGTGTQILGTATGSYTLIKGSDAAFSDTSLNGPDANGWFHIFVVMSRDKSTDSWVVNVINKSKSETEIAHSATLSNKDGITALLMGINSANGAVYKDVSIKHYSSYISGLAAHSDSSREIVEYEADIKTIEEDAVIIAALYHGDKLIAYHTHDLADINDGKVSGTFEDYETINSDPTIKIMMWDSLEGLTPLVTNQEQIVPENIAVVDNNQ